MNKILGSILKGLISAFVIITVGGLVALNIKATPSTSMMLISSSVVNSLKTNRNKEEVKVEEVSLEEEVSEIEEKEEVKEEPKKEEKVEEKKVETPVVETPKPSAPASNGSYSPTTTEGESNFTYEGWVTAYGPDCVGCGGYTRMGDNVTNNIYYNHPTYGSIRIVAGDSDMLNKVVRITGLNISSEPVIAIVRDTGGDIGRNKSKKIVLDLLYSSESSPEVLNFGKQWAKVEVIS